MTTAIHLIPSGVTNSVFDERRTFVVLTETVGTVGDAPATDVAAENSAISLLKGICAGLGLPAGSGAGVTNTSPDTRPDLLSTLGNMDDVAATDPDDPNSAISLLKGCLVALGL